MNFEKYIKQNIEKSILRFITCGSVDDGKSTLIGRLLFDSHKIYEDQLSAVTRDSRKYGTQGEGTDLALLLDGLQSEREQKITIDVAYRYFSTNKRKFIIADCPGHEQYTRNMATGASTADAAVILIDARKGILPQTLRHYKIVEALGVQSIIVVINKMDTVGYSQDRYQEIELEVFRTLTDKAWVIPVSALHGDNVVNKSDKMEWWSGTRYSRTLLDALENIENRQPCDDDPTRLPVQYIVRPNQDYRGYAGNIAGGSLTKDCFVTVLPQRELTKITSIMSAGIPVDSAEAGEAVVVTLADDIDVARGNLIVRSPCDSDRYPKIGKTVEARMVWLSEEALSSSDTYEFKVGTQRAYGTIEGSLQLNEIGIVIVRFQSDVIFDPYTQNRHTGSLIVINRISNATMGAGMLIRDRDVFFQSLTITKAQRSRNHKPRIIWFTGLSGSGKSTLANALEVKLFQQGYPTYVLDGDNLRTGLSKDLEFSHADRTENIRRAGEVAKLFIDAGITVLCAFISPYENDRELVRSLVAPNEFVEIYVSTSLDVCRSRDPKGLYAKGILGSEYEPPKHPDFVIDTEKLAVNECVSIIFDSLNTR